MKHMVFLDRRAGELEKILSGVKTMLIKDIAPAQSTALPVSPADCLYFLRSKDECDLLVTATVVRVLPVTSEPGEGLAQILKEMQPRLRLTEDQFNFWSANKQALLVEFEAARKIGVIQIASHKTMDRSDWIAFESFNQITDQKVSDEDKTFPPEIEGG
jgi:hypothetical protein